MATLRFTIRGEMYTAADMDEISILATLRLAEETREAGRQMSFGEATALIDDYGKLKTDDERLRSSDAMWVIALTVWATRVVIAERAGQPMPTFIQAIDFSLRDIEFLKPTQDHLESANPTKARPRSGRARSAPARKRAAPSPRPTKSAAPASTGG